MYKIQTLNKISAIGLNDFPRDSYEVATDINNADAILVRSAEMHGMELPSSMKAVARAGAGTNNIPSAELAEKGENISVEEVKKSLSARDKQDSTRKIAPAIPASDAIMLDNSGSFDETVDRALKIIESRIK